MSLKIFYNSNSTEWRAFEAPEKTGCDCDTCKWDYNQALSEAAKNSLPVLNQELVPENEREWMRVNKNYLYNWPGTYEKKTAYEYIDGTKEDGYVLTLPAPVKEEDEGTFGNLKFKVGSILSEEFLKWNDGKFHSPIELNPATHALAEFFSSELLKKEKQIHELKIEASKWAFECDRAKQERDKAERENEKLKLASTKTLELLEGNPTWTIDELHKYLKSLNEWKQ